MHRATSSTSSLLFSLAHVTPRPKFFAAEDFKEDFSGTPFASSSSSVGLLELRFYKAIGQDTVRFSHFIKNQFCFRSCITSKNITISILKYNGGLSYTKEDFSAAVNLNDKGDTRAASYYHIVNPFVNTSVGAEICHRFSSKDNAFTIGAQHAVDPLTVVKAKVNNYGKASALIQHERRPKSLFTISGEVDTRAVEKSAKVPRNLQKIIKAGSNVDQI